MVVQEYNKINEWVENLTAKGKYAFSLAQVQLAFNAHSVTAIKSALIRLSKQGKILSIHKGYYLIITPQFRSKGILPPNLFLDEFMKFLNRPYYLGLLNAAAYHGAAHQQPQEFFVVTTYPALRPTFKKGLKINYIIKNEIDNTQLEAKKTEAGYLQISNPLLTATDIIQFEKRIGGLNRAATVLNELVEVMQPKDFNTKNILKSPIAILQRLGYILEYEINNKKLADILYKIIKNESLFKIPLKLSAPTKGFIIENRWKIIVNTKLEIDD
jgi:predicted transcriptional regulator of viral defense system